MAHRQTVKWRQVSENHRRQSRTQKITSTTQTNMDGLHERLDSTKIIMQKSNNSGKQRCGNEYPFGDSLDDYWSEMVAYLPKEYESILQEQSDSWVGVFLFCVTKHTDTTLRMYERCKERFKICMHVLDGHPPYIHFINGFGLFLTKSRLLRHFTLYIMYCDCSPTKTCTFLSMKTKYCRINIRDMNSD